MKIALETMLPDVLSRYPSCRKIFDRYGLSGCGGPQGTARERRVLCARSPGRQRSLTGGTRGGRATRRDQSGPNRIRGEFGGCDLPGVLQGCHRGDVHGRLRAGRYQSRHSGGPRTTCGARPAGDDLGARACSDCRLGDPFRDGLCLPGLPALQADQALGAALGVRHLVRDGRRSGRPRDRRHARSRPAVASRRHRGRRHRDRRRGSLHRDRCANLRSVGAAPATLRGIHLRGAGMDGRRFRGRPGDFHRVRIDPWRTGMGSVHRPV